MATIYWKLGHITAQGFQRPLKGFVVFRDGKVFDVDGEGWDRGIRSGEDMSELKWRYPGVTLVPWQAKYYQKPLESLKEWLRDHAVAYQQEDIRAGWWEWPRITEMEWRRLLEGIVPSIAQRVDAGIASHPWLAHWIADEGPQLALPVWKHSSGETYVLEKGDEERFWMKMPLRYVEGISLKEKKMWHKCQWRSIKDVPGLLSRIHQLDGSKEKSEASEIVLIRRFDDSVDEGIGHLMYELAEELGEKCQAQNQGVWFMRVTWSGNKGVERREREWSEAKGDIRSLMARTLSLLNYPPQHPFDEMRLEARTKGLQLSQLAWWQDTRKRPSVPSISGLTRFSLPRRELLLQQWDLWRMAGR